ncbi:hypothetical protein X798_04707, partial [Onchocerca flexuosa]
CAVTAVIVFLSFDGRLKLTSIHPTILALCPFARLHSLCPFVCLSTVRLEIDCLFGWVSNSRSIASLRDVTAIDPIRQEMPLYPTLEDLLIDQYQHQQYGNYSGNDSPPVRSHAEPSAPLYESNSSTSRRIYEAIDETAISTAPQKMSGYPSLPSYYESISQPEHIPVLKPSAQSPEATVISLPYPHLSQSVAIQSYMSNMLTSTESEWIIAPITSQCYGLTKANLTHGVRKVILNRTKSKKYGLRMRAVNQVMDLLKKSKHEVILILRDRYNVHTINLRFEKI